MKSFKKLVCAGLVTLALAGAAREVRASAVTTAYEFLPDQSTVVQTGGFAGIYETHSIEGQFRLTVDLDAGTASFDHVDATLSENLFLYTQNLGVLFNMTELLGSIVSDTEIEFTGLTADGTNTEVFIRLTFVDDSVHLTGEIVPGCCDQFNYNLDAVAVVVTQPYCGDANHPYPVGDLNQDCYVDVYDYAVLVLAWMSSPGSPNWNPSCDISDPSDDVINEHDLVVFTAHWLECTVPVNSNSILKDGIEYYMQTDKFIYNSGEEVKMLYRVTNLTDQDVTFNFTDQVQHYFTVKDDGNLIWDAPKVGFPALSCFTLSPNGYKEYSENWDMVDNQGVLIVPGNYEITGSLHPILLGDKDKYVPVSVQIEIIP